jgi:cell division protein FtsL
MLAGLTGKHIAMTGRLGSGPALGPRIRGARADMAKLNLALILAVLASGLALVHNAYESRRLFAERDRIKAEGQRLAADAERLKAERHAQATNLRVEQVARERLGMRLITPAVVASGVSQ